ncbi:MAG: DUF4132 domain-containing protein, partial [Bacteroidota bacterium]
IKQHLEALRNLILENRNFEYEVSYKNGSRENLLLGNTFQSIKPLEDNQPLEEIKKNYPLYELWHEWWKKSKLLAFDLWLIVGFDYDDYFGYQEKDDYFVRLIKDYLPIIKVPQIQEYRWSDPLTNVLKYLAECYPTKPETIVDYYIFLSTKMDKKALQTPPKLKRYYSDDVFYWRETPALLNLRREVLGLMEKLDDRLFQKAWQIEWWGFTKAKSILKHPFNALPSLTIVARAYELQLIQKDELLYKVLTVEGIKALSESELDFKARMEFRAKLKKEFPWLFDLYQPIQERLLDIELRRGDSATEASDLVLKINGIKGIDRFVDLLQALGKETLNRGYIYQWGDTQISKKQQLSRLLKVCFPKKEETAAALRETLKGKEISENRLLEAAMYSPQWLSLIAEVLGWQGLQSAVWWLHAHTNANHDAQTETEIAKFSNISMNDFKDGAVDIQWFRDAYRELGKTKWSKLYKCAKYISDSNGHRRAQLYADVQLGQTKITEVTKRVKEKRNQDYVRVYGLIPLSKKVPQKDLLKRYQYLQQFLKESRQFGAQKQASEKRAVAIALDNLARTAGYRDSIRLRWTMETRLAQSIMDEMAPFAEGDIRVSLDINQDGTVDLNAFRGGQKLKFIPAKVRKHKAIVQLKSYQKTLKDQYARAKKSMEQAMVLKDTFERTELLELLDHPVIAPLLQRLVFVGDHQMGWLRKNGLLTPSESSIALPEQLRIAHSVDLHQSGQWSTYMRYCFENQIKQPFKQIYRELYLPTADEQKDQTKSLRYA